MKVISFTVAQLTNGSQFAFIQAIIKAARKCEAIVSNAKKQLKVLEAMFRIEDEVMLRHAKSPLTKKIQELDAERDRLYSMIRAICKAMRDMMDADRKQAATEVFDVIAAYGYISTYKYDRQTGMLENLCQDLQGSHAHLVAQLGLTEAVARLKQANDDFAAFVAERAESKGVLIRGEMAAARQDTEQAYYALIEVVNSLSTLFVAGGGATAENPYADFINYANQEINRLKISELKQKTRSEEAEPLLGHQFGWENPADGTDPDYPTTPGENTPSNPGGGTNTPTEPGGSTNPPTTEPTNPGGGTVPPTGGEPQTWPVIDPNDQTIYTGQLYNSNGSGSIVYDVSGKMNTPFEIPEPYDGYMWPTNMPSVMPPCDFVAHTLPVDSDVTTFYKLEYKDGDTVLRTDYLHAGDIVFLYPAPDGKEWEHIPRSYTMPAKDWVISTKDAES